MGAMSIQTFMKSYSVGHTKVYELLASGALKGRKVGSKTVIDRETAEKWYNNLPEYQSNSREVF